MSFGVVETIVGSVAALLITIFGVVAAWQRIKPTPPCPKEDDGKIPEDIQNLINLVRELEKSVVVLEQKVGGEVSVKIEHLRADIDILFKKVDKTIDVIINHTR